MGNPRCGFRLRRRSQKNQSRGSAFDFIQSKTQGIPAASDFYQCFF